MSCRCAIATTLAIRASIQCHLHLQPKFTKLESGHLVDSGTGIILIREVDKFEILKQTGQKVERNADVSYCAELFTFQNEVRSSSDVMLPGKS